MSDNAVSADNPQETLNSSQYYYAGFLAAEMTCSVIRARQIQRLRRVQRILNDHTPRLSKRERDMV